MEKGFDRTVAREVFALSDYRKGMVIHALIGLVEVHTGKSARQVLREALQELERQQ